MSKDVLDLEAQLVAAFDADEWSAGDAATEERTSDNSVREVRMELIPLGGSRPSAN